MPNISDTPGKSNAPAESAVAGPRAATATTTTTTPGAQPPATATTPTTPGGQPAAAATASGTTVLSTASPSTSTSPPTTSVAVTVPNTTGTVTFSLVVTDNLNVQSAPAFATVTIQAAPKAALTATPAVLTEGGTIQLSGSGSTSSGSIKTYLFSLVPPTNPIT